MKVWVVTQPAGDDTEAVSIAEIYDNEKTARSHAKRIWAGDVSGPYEVLRDMPGWVTEHLAERV